MKRFTAITLAALMVLAVFASVIPTSATTVTSYDFMDGIIDAPGVTPDTGDEMNITSESAPSILYYAFEDGEGLETLVVNITDDLTIEDTEFDYTTTLYLVGDDDDKEIAYLGAPFAVISNTTSKWILSEKLVDEDEDDDHTFRVGDSLSFPEGWELTAKEINVDGDQVWLSLSKDGEEVDSSVVNTNTTYVYEEDLDDDGDVDDVVLSAFVENVFAGMTTNMAILNNVDLFSNEVRELKDGSKDEIDDYVIDLTESTINIDLDTDEEISLSKDDTTEILGGFVSIKLNKDGDKAAAVKTVSEPGTYEFMDGIIDAPGVTPDTGDEMNITSENAPSILYYAFEDGEGLETLVVNITDDLTIEDTEFDYTTTLYLVGDDDDKEIAYLGAPFSVISNTTSKWILSEKLVDEDEDDDHTFRVGDSLSFPEGWELTAQEINVDGDQVWLSLSKDGEEVDSSVVNTNSTYVYEEDLDDDGDVDDVVLSAFVENVFAGMTTNMAILNNVDLFSNEVRELKDGSKDEIDDYVIDLTESTINIDLDTDEEISLSKDDTTEILGGFVSIKLNKDGDKAAAVKTVTIAGDDEEVVDEEVVDEEVVDEEVVDEEVVDEEVIVDEVVDEEVVVDEVADEVVDEEPPEEEPGFEAIFAIAGLLAVAFLVRRNK